MLGLKPKYKEQVECMTGALNFIYKEIYDQIEKKIDLLIGNAGIKAGGRSKESQILREKYI